MPTTTDAIIAPAPGASWEFKRVTLADVAPDEILVDIVAAGLCHTDVKAASGKFGTKIPLILGHEGVGYVKEVGNQVSHLAVGDAVVLSYASCRKCAQCCDGYPAYCHDLRSLNFGSSRSDGTPVAWSDDGSELGGLFFGQSSFAKVALVNQSCAVKVEVDSREELQKLVLGCSLQTGAGTVLNVCSLDANSSIAIWGCGGVGLAAVMAAKTRGPKVLVAIDTAPSKLELAKKYGATHTICATSEDVISSLMAITKGVGVNYALDAVGSASILRAGQQALACRGTLVTIGSALEDITLDSRLQLQRGLTYRGCHQGDSDPFEMLPRLLKLWRSRNFPFDELLAFYQAEDFPRALADVKDGTTVKAVLLF